MSDEQKRDRMHVWVLSLFLLGLLAWLLWLKDRSG